MDAVAALEELGGIAPVAQWRELVGRAAARDALADGTVVRLPRHQVALPGADQARRTAAALGGVVSHLSAAQVHGWKLKASPHKPCVTVPRTGRLTGDAATAAEVHWADLDDDAIDDGVTTPLQTVVDCARAYDRQVALSVADSALRSGVVDRGDLVDAAHRAPRTGRRRALWVAENASDLAANPFESVLRAIALEVDGLDVRPQGWIGTIGRADLVDGRLLMAIEGDSWEFHGTQDAFKVDVRRYTDFAALGWVVLRFLWVDVMHRPDWVHERLTQAVAVRTRQLAPRPCCLQLASPRRHLPCSRDDAATNCRQGLAAV